MRKNLLLIVLFAIVTTVISYTSCTYDYFEDEINYIVYVPEVVDKTVRDCRVIVFDEAGTFIGEKYGVAPFDKDPRIKIGQFGFRLAPGSYNVYCYTNTDSLNFEDTSSWENASFKMLTRENSDENYVQPPEVFYEKKKPTIIHPAFLSVDTAAFKRYTGRLTIRFKNFPVEAFTDDASGLSSVENVYTIANGIATKQLLQLDTLSTRVTDKDYLTHTDKPVSKGVNNLELDYRLFPSIENQLSVLKFDFLDSNGERLLHFPDVDIADFDTQVPLRLLHGRRMIVEIDRYVVNKVTIVDWDEDVPGEDVNMQ